MTTARGEQQESSSNKYVIVSTRDDLMITKEITRRLASEIPSSQIVVACPTPCTAGAQVWVDKIQKDGATIQVLPFDPYGDRAACRRASDELMKGLGDGVINALVMNWQGCIPGRFGVVLEESGMLEMAQVKILSQMYFVESLIEKKLIFDSSRVIVSGSEAVRGIPSICATPAMGDSLDFYVSALNGTGLDLADGMSIYSHIQGILSLYIASLARKHPSIYFWLLSPGFTQDSMNKHIQIEETPAHELHQITFEQLVEFGIAQDYKIAASNFLRAITGSPEWNYPNGVLVGAAQGSRGDLCDQAALEGGKYLSDHRNQDLACEALHSFA